MSRFEVLSDAQWSLIADLLPGPTGRPGRPFADARRMVEAIVYRYGCTLQRLDQIPARCSRSRETCSASGAQ